MLEVALGRHSADTAPAQQCIWSIRAFCRAARARCGAGVRVDRRGRVERFVVG